MTEHGLATVGLVIALGTLGAILWSVARPDRRIWPPQEYGPLTPYLVWVPTFSLFGIIIVLGILGWGDLKFPEWCRYGIGIPLIIAGNLAVWYEVPQFGMAQTSGARGRLRTSGLYRFSRNPQYVADTVMLVGWMLLSASPWVTVVGSAAIVALLAAPFAEETWLSERYGRDFEDYAVKVRRFL